MGAHAVSLHSINRMTALCALIGILRGLHAVPGSIHSMVMSTIFSDASFSAELLDNLIAYHGQLQAASSVPADVLLELHQLLDALQAEFLYVLTYAFFLRFLI